jgi:hypothetical protein
MTGDATRTLSALPSADARDVRQGRGMLPGLEQLGYDLDALLASAGFGGVTWRLSKRICRRGRVPPCSRTPIMNGLCRIWPCSRLNAYVLLPSRPGECDRLLADLRSVGNSKICL